jgi:NitT/TauT family transport system permease protein
MIMPKSQEESSMKERVARGLLDVVGNPLVVTAFVGIGIWWILAGRIIEFLPSPIQVGVAFVEAITSLEFYLDMAVTLRRVILAATGAWMVAVVLGITMANSWPIETAGNPLVFIGLAVPAPLSIFFSIMIFGLGETTTIYGGAKARDKRLIQMATAYRFSRRQQLRHIILPELSPSLMSGARFAFAMGWKIVVLVEALSSNVGIGERIHYFFVFNQPHRVIGWTLTFTVVMLIVERYVFTELEKRLFAWRPQKDLGGGLAQAA